MTGSTARFSGTITLGGGRIVPAAVDLIYASQKWRVHSITPTEDGGTLR